MNEYKGEPPIFHFDFYRLESEDDLVSINIEDYLPADPGVSIIEWGNKFEHILPENRIDLDFYYHGSDSRLIKLSKNLQEMIEK
jgi:tRNA threonylcarbamoyladenosine biosynthesis protein TsaE